jgi:serine/threonine protein kinase
MTPHRSITPHRSMTPHEWEEVKERFHDALEQPVENRQSYLMEACLDDFVRTEVARLLIEHDRVGAFLGDPAEANPSGAFTARSSTVDDDLDSAESLLNGLPELFQNINNHQQASGSPGLFAGRIVGAYRLIRELGQGGMGTVWLGERADGLLKRPVAIKLPHAGIYGRHFIERFQREREILASLTHPHIGRLYDAGVTNEGEPFLTLEYIEGKELIGYCDSQQLGIRARLKLFLQVLSAVQHANSHLVIHRDIKPSNILVDSGGEVKLLDFGVARLIIDDGANEIGLTQMTGAPLTPGYASPEQIMGEPIGIGSDIYSLGVVLCELLTGERPYRVRIESRASLEEAVLAADIARPSQAVPSADKVRARGAGSLKKLSATLRGDLDTIVMKALARQPEQRYATADAFLQDIERYLQGRAVHAQPESVWYRAKKFTWRNRFAVGAVAAVILALAAGLTTALWEARKAREQAKTAESVLAFMEGIFKANAGSQSDPVKARETTARQLLDIGADHLVNTLNDVPAAKLKVMDSLTQMYADLDIWDKQLDIDRKRVELARSIYGASDPAFADVLLDLAVDAANLDLQAEGLRAVGEAGRILDKRGDHTSELRVGVEGRLADFSLNVDLPQALSHAREAVRLARALPPSYEQVDNLQSAVYFEQEMGHYEAAETISAEALTVARSRDDASILLSWIYKHLAEAQDGAEDLTNAGQNYTAARDMARKYNPTQGPFAQLVDFAYANFLAETSRIGEGLAVAGPAHEIAWKLSRQGVSSGLLPDGVIAYGRALIDYGRIEEGLEVFGQAEAMRADLPPSLSNTNLRIDEERGAGLIETGRYAEAEALLNKAAAKQRQQNRKDTPGYNRNLAIRAHLLNVTGRGDEALKILEEYWIPPIPPGRVSRPKLEELILRSEISLSRDDFNSASNLAAEAQALIASSPNRPWLALWEARAALAEGRAKLHGGNAHEALPLLEKAVTLRTGLLDAASPALADADIALSNCYLDLRGISKASMMLGRAKAIQRVHAVLGEHYRKPLRDLEHGFSALVSYRSALAR